MKVRPRVGISACLLGEPVRWDGGDKRDHRLLATLGGRVRWVPVCPEVELGPGGRGRRRFIERVSRRAARRRSAS